MAEISVIIPLYNKENYIGFCLDSLLRQTFGDFEIIIADDGSLDRSVSLVESYQAFDKRIKLIKLEHKGVGAARNKALECVSSKYATFVDADDYVSPLYLEKLHFAIEDKNASYAFCNIFQADDKTRNLYFVGAREKDGFIKDGVIIEKDAPPSLYFHILTCACARIYKMEFIKDIKFVEDIIFEDSIFATECYLLSDRISYDLNPYYFYRTGHQNSIVQTFNKKQFDIFKAQKIRINLFKKYGKYEKYKDGLLLHNLREVMERISNSNNEIRKEFFEMFKKEYSNINYSEFNLDNLNKIPLFRHAMEMLK